MKVLVDCIYLPSQHMHRFRGIMELSMPCGTFMMGKELLLGHRSADDDNGVPMLGRAEANTAAAFELII